MKRKNKQSSDVDLSYLNQCFDKDGNLPFDMYEIYNLNKQNKSIFDYLFDDDGNVNVDIYNELETFIDKNQDTIHPLSDVVQIYISRRIHMVTKSNYNDLILWR